MEEKSFLSNEFLVFRKEEDLGILFNPATGLIKVLNETGILIWNFCLAKKRTPEEITQKICGEFSDISREKATQDVNNFLEQMKKNNFFFEVG